MDNEEAQTIPSDGSDDTRQDCVVCGIERDSSQLLQCGICLNTCCEECTFQCDKCEIRTCNNDGVNCAVCNDNICNDCEHFTCNVCKQDVCENCNIGNADAPKCSNCV